MFRSIRGPPYASDLNLQGAAPMDVRLLGSVEVSSAGVLLTLGGPRQRAVLAALALRSGHTVSTVQLIDDLWGDRPPASAKPTLESYVSRLRRVLAAAGADGVSLVTRPSGYMLDVVPDQLDVRQFRDLAARGGDAFARGDAATAVGLLRSALGLWRGPALADVREAAFAAVAARHLEEEWLTAHENLVEAKFCLGQHREAVPELEALIAGSPYRERFHAQLMLALYRSGRQAEALSAFSRVRDVLAEDLGIEPGRELRELQHAILIQAPELEPANDVNSRLVGHKVARSEDVFAPGLPVQLTTFIGRDAEMAEVGALLADSRVVTLTGAGGVGKTRLALQVAAEVSAEFPAGAWLVDLAPFADGGLVPLVVARAMGLPDEAGRQPTSTVAAFVGDGRALVVLDNCEHVLDACAMLAADLLLACRALVVLATSREPLGVAGEATWRVPSLSADDATGLFADRGRRARPGFSVSSANAEAVAEICRSLDGLPLAIELAAARLRAFSPAEIVGGLHNRFHLLTTGSRTAVPRQQTLRASVDWSHALLTDTEQALFRRLAVFAGGFDLPALQAVAAADGLDPHEVPGLLALLVDKSLVATEDSPAATRYRLLETIRQYAAEKLSESGEAAAVRNRHHIHYAAVAAGLDALPDGQARRRSAVLEGEIGNLRAAFEWSLETSDTEGALRLASSLQPLWLGRCRMAEGLAWFDAALDSEPVGAADVAPDVRVRAVADAVVLEWWIGTVPRWRQAREGVAVAREIGDPALLARALLGAGYAAGPMTDHVRPFLAEATVLARQSADVWTLAQLLGREATAANVSGDPVAGRSAAEEGQALAGKVGNDHVSRQSRVCLGVALIMQGDLHRAKAILAALVEESEADRVQFWQMWGLGALGEALALMGQVDEARAACQASIAIGDNLGSAFGWVVPGYSGLAIVAMACGDAGALREATTTGWRRANFRPELGVEPLTKMGEADLAVADLVGARQHAEHAVAVATKLAMKVQLMRALITRARVAAAEEDAGLAREDAHHALIIGHSIQARPGIADALECLGKLTSFDQDLREAARLFGAAQAIRRATCYQRFALHQDGYDAAIRALGVSMGEAEFSQAFDEGAALTIDEAVSYALRGTAPVPKAEAEVRAPTHGAAMTLRSD
jgi:predicted ATPase/DNA-binding SARP family transcriptional activator